MHLMRTSLNNIIFADILPYIRFTECCNIRLILNYFLKKIKAVYLLSDALNDKIFSLQIKGKSMAQQLDPKELATFKELLISNSIQVEALTQLLVEKGLINFEEVFDKPKEVQKNYKKPL